MNYEIMYTGEANAYATPEGKVVVTSALLDILNEKELEAVMQHEMRHIAHKHVMQNRVFSSLLAFNLWTRTLTSRKAGKTWLTWFFFNLMAIFLFNWKNEFVADGIEDKEALASALSKIQDWNRTPMMQTIFTHPPVQFRLFMLQKGQAK